MMKKTETVVRCPQCGYRVPNFFEHVDKDCSSDEARKCEEVGIPYDPPDSED